MSCGITWKAASPEAAYWRKLFSSAASTVGMKPARPNGVGAAAAGVAFGATWFFRLAPQCGHQGGMRPSGLAKTCFEQLPQLVADAMIGTRKRLIIGALPNFSSRVI